MLINGNLDALTPVPRRSDAWPDRGLRECPGKDDLHAVIEQVRVDDHKIEIIGSKASLAAAIAGQQTSARNVSGFVRKWRARQDSNP